jgi:hypothetical protein
MNPLDFDEQVLQSKLPVRVEAQKFGVLSKFQFKACIEINP